jgi:hypothetical protein
LLTAAVLLLVALGGGLGLGRDRIVLGLASIPRPLDMKAAAAPPLGEEASGARSLSAARRLGENGAVAGALTLLRTIPREDPAFPAAERLRSELEGLSGRAGGR